MMIKKSMTAIALLALMGFAQNKLWVATGGQVRFFSSTPMEDIEAKSQTAVSTLDPHTGALEIKIRNTSFEFPNKLMQEHFNENYMESEKFPVSEFHGQVLGADSALMASGKNVPITVKGSMLIHGVKKEYSVPSTLRLEKDGSYSGDVKFKVRIADHGIQIPTIVMAKIAEEVEITAKFFWKKPG